MSKHEELEHKELLDSMSNELSFMMHTLLD